MSGYTEFEKPSGHAERTKQAENLNGLEDFAARLASVSPIGKQETLDKLHQLMEEAAEESDE